MPIASRAMCGRPGQMSIGSKNRMAGAAAIDRVKTASPSRPTGRSMIPGLLFGVNGMFRLMDAISPARILGGGDVQQVKRAEAGDRFRHPGNDCSAHGRL